MSISLENKTRSFTKDEAGVFVSYVEKALSLMLSMDYIDPSIRNGDAEISVDIRLVGSDAIKKLNSRYRQKDKVTDVLSFPILDMMNNSLFILYK